MKKRQEDKKESDAKLKHELFDAEQAEIKRKKRDVMLAKKAEAAAKEEKER
jgi:hypothetical protein